MAPSALALISRLPRLHPTLLFPTRTGKQMSQSNWTTYWHPLRDAFAADLPAEHWLARRIAKQSALRDAQHNPNLRARIGDGKLDFYELRHRAITYMGTPGPDGLGLAAPDIAHQVGHSDGGLLIERVYTHRSPEQARDRIRAAMESTTKQTTTEVHVNDQFANLLGERRGTGNRPNEPEFLELPKNAGAHRSPPLHPEREGPTRPYARRSGGPVLALRSSEWELARGTTHPEVVLSRGTAWVHRPVNGGDITGGNPGAVDVSVERIETEPNGASGFTAAFANSDAPPIMLP